jgi:ComF family protein
LLLPATVLNTYLQHINHNTSIMRLIEHIFRLLAPDECISCAQESSLLCEPCGKSKLELIPARCYRCLRAMPNFQTCPACRHQSVLQHVWTRTAYNQTAKQLVHALKYKNAKDAACPIARELLKVLPPLPKRTVIVHVPTATSHVRQRGFDQSAVIARELAYHLKFPHIHVLGRLGQQRQVGSSRQTRRLHMQDAFRALSLGDIKGAHILLIDDVLTTGSTLEAAGRTLVQAGAASVAAATFVGSNMTFPNREKLL